MNEEFLYYIWQYQYFSRTELHSVQGDPIRILDPGIRNKDAGPDFSNARILIGDLEWRGHVEIHVSASDWKKHNHHHDPAFGNVILHVVWISDQPIVLTDGSEVPTLELKDRVNTNLLDRYKRLVTTTRQIPCENQLPAIGRLVWVSQLERAVVQRMETKSHMVLNVLKECTGDWEEVTYRLFLRTLGMKVNAEPFEDLARALPYRVIRKHTGNRMQVEALLFGTAGMLSHPGKEEYHRTLAREYHHLGKKYGLGESQMAPSAWKFMRLRPSNFPTLRIAQAAAVLAARKNMFAHWISPTGIGFGEFFDVEVSPYWQTHVRFGKKSRSVSGKPGADALRNIAINATVPVLFAYGRYKDDPVHIERGMRILQALPAENNTIVRRWTALGMRPGSAFDSQGMIGQFNEYCLRRQCLNCAIGFHLLKNG